MSRFSLILLFVVLLAAPARAVDTDAKYYHRAFAALESNNAQQAEALAERGPDQLLNKVVRGYAMALPGNDYPFEELNAFITGNPGWPGLKGIQMIAEQKIPPNAVPAQVVAWFSARPPVTVAGFYRYADALNQTGMAQAAENAVRARWINNDFTGDEQTVFYARYGALLDRDTMWARMDRLLWKEDDVEARRLIPYLDSTDASVAGARLALANQSRDAEMWLSRVPSGGQNDPGLLYQVLRWRVKNNLDDDADDILLRAPARIAGSNAGAEAWWDQRQVMVRRAIARRDYDLAYRLASEYGQTEPKSLVQAEFLSGWIALRFINQPTVALKHFQTLYDNASTPVTRARGAYWLGRTYEALGNKNAAEQAYEDGAAFNTAYYGQLAATRLYANPVLTAKADPPLPEAAHRALMSRDILHAIVRLSDIGEPERAHTFFHAATESATERAEFIVLTEIAAHMHRPDLGIQAVKAAAQKDMLIENGGFPLISMHVPTPPESAFTHALIRQESMFNPDAASGVGARGLMQLMPRTAKEVAKKAGVRYKETLLSDPAYSMKLGTAFVQEQIEHFNGSYILALAGYNAGPGRVHEWLSEFGDPRNDNMDPVDWVELIPLQETRNYVQRIIESLQIYRAKLAGGQSRLLIINDLRR
ncbi:MAG: lytic transglycosylase domain-containing protein [Alphaproteobacteria bacterium]